MLDSMRQLALDSLWVELAQGKGSDPEIWYRKLRVDDPSVLFPKLVEDTLSGSANQTIHYYTLRPDPQDDQVAILKAHEFKPSDSKRLPFNQPSGSQSAALGPLVKRTPPSKAKAAGPTVKIQQTTLKSFETFAAEKPSKPWSGYFRRALECWGRPKVRFEEEIHGDADNALEAAIHLINEKRTVLLAYEDDEDRLPGDVPEYVEYLQAVLAQTKYATNQIPAQQNKTCALCGQGPLTVYPNALRGAGINLANLDRDGAFPGLEPVEAWKGYALCIACADLLYVFWNHLAKDYLTNVAGERALVIPSTQLDSDLRKEFTEEFQDYVRRMSGKAVQVGERLLEEIVQHEKAITTLTFLWADFGQRIDNVKGIITDVLPSRLRHLTQDNREMNQAQSPIFPEVILSDIGFTFDLSLFILRSLYRRPGGKKAESSNASKRLFELKREIATCIYHGEPVPTRRLFDELHETARWHWGNACDSGYIWGLLNEGHSDKKGKSFLTVAGWIRHLAKFLHYLRFIKVLPMIETIYQPKSEALKPYFTTESAIDSPAKAFAFILGALYGKVMQLQAARGVNVGANALTWLKRLTLSGRDLPELYLKIREKLLAYETEGNPTVREIVSELGELGIQLGTDIDLDETATCYFLLLGQSLTTKIIPGKTREQGDSE